MESIMEPLSVFGFSGNMYVMIYFSSIKQPFLLAYTHTHIYIFIYISTTTDHQYTDYTTN